MVRRLIPALAAAACALGCLKPSEPVAEAPRPPSPGASAGPVSGKDRAGERKAMVDLLSRYSAEHRVTDRRVLAAMLAVPRHEFVPAEAAELAYADQPLPIGEGQTISQPFIVGYMTEAMELEADDKVLEIGTGSGYQAAVLSLLVREVYSIEIVEPLAERAEATLRRLGYENVKVKAGDGYRGWPEHAPFDAIIVTCAPDHVPQPLADQLKLGGRLVIPVGAELSGYWSAQELVVVRKSAEGLKREDRMGVRFVPMTGEARGRR
ncbi:MAG: protein-L-isoaspartate(D-aspartate) O-methyltransferase [Elusimicrobia bacterium]|nr:protein-L-isoaspartate(D-aspartate) O-methyltransferase [Elusimicrobiota bacterium]